MIRVADYIFQTLANLGVNDVFLVTGGGAMHLNDAIAREKRLRFICNHHEQASAIAAEGYARIKGKLGVACVTSGPGGINAINGVFGAWTDSIPVLVISGQMKRETLLEARGLTGKLRQLGDQEVDIISMVKGITKYAKTILEPESIRYHLERALYLCQNGRPGPVWLDIPLDVQASIIDPSQLKGYDLSEDILKFDQIHLREQARDVADKIRKSKRPVILGGTGVRLSGAIDEFNKLAELCHIPITTAWTHDLVESSNPLFAGRQGTIGTRAGNFVVQNSDFLLIVGSRLCIRQISYNWTSFARHAYTVQVDIDSAELDKPTFKANMSVNADAKLFLRLLIQELNNGYVITEERKYWVNWCRERVAKLPNVLPRHRVSAPGTINQYHFVELLFSASSNGDIFACGDATACITPFQAGYLKLGQRMFSNSGSASMGYDLPAAIGAAVASGRRVICLAGDGSLQMNVQELATVAHNKLPIKLFILNNGGYLSIRSTQQNFFKLLVGEGPESGVSFPDYKELARAYGIPARILNTASALEEISAFLARPGPEIMVVELDRSQGFEPKLSSKRLLDGTMITAPLEDMAPFLDRDEFRSHMIVPVLD
jgi:acetolactate synthase I/II/III large subunit